MLIWVLALNPETGTPRRAKLGPGESPARDEHLVHWLDVLGKAPWSAEDVSRCIHCRDEHGKLQVWKVQSPDDKHLLGGHRGGMTRLFAESPDTKGEEGRCYAETFGKSWYFAFFFTYACGAFAHSIPLGAKSQTSVCKRKWRKCTSRICQGQPRPVDRLGCRA